MKAAGQRSKKKEATLSPPSSQNPAGCDRAANIGAKRQPVLNIPISLPTTADLGLSCRDLDKKVFASGSLHKHNSITEFAVKKESELGDVMNMFQGFSEVRAKRRIRFRGGRVQKNNMSVVSLKLILGICRRPVIGGEPHQEPSGDQTTRWTS